MVGKMTNRRPAVCGLCLNYWVVGRILVFNYKQGFVLLIRPPGRSQQTEILDRCTHILRAGNVWKLLWSQQMFLVSACAASCGWSLHLPPFCWLQRAIRQERWWSDHNLSCWKIMPLYHNLIVCNKTHMEFLGPSFIRKLSTGFQAPLS